MKNYYSISIPKPCHEDWNQMSPKQKGRFCNSCSKTVIDFTKMDTYEIQDFISENKNSRICGHFKQTQLDSINIHIPSRVLEQQQSFHKLFLLALLIAMGTTLFNCTNKNGNQQKIDSIEVVDTISNQVVDILGGIQKIEESDSTVKKTCKMKPKNLSIPEIIIDGELVLAKLGEVETIEQPIVEIDSLDNYEMVEPVGLIVYEEGDSLEDEELTVGMIQVETPPEFKNTPSSLSNKEKKDYFSKQISNIIHENFRLNTTSNLGIKGVCKIQTQFKIDTLGFVFDIKVRAPHLQLEKEAKRVLKLLPQFTPATQSGKPVTMVYSLPIIFQVEE
ncbi:MAG: energy transducer TonB [Algibacter sp.]